MPKHAPPARPRPPDARLVRRAVDGTRGRQPGLVGGSQLEHVEAVRRLVRPMSRPLLDRVGSGIEKRIEPFPFVRLERIEDVVLESPLRSANADPKAAELLGPELIDDRAQAVVSARPPVLAEAELAEGEGEVVGDDEEIAEWRVLAGKDLANGQTGVVHEGQRLDDREVETLEPAHRDRRRVACPTLAGPAGTIGEAVEHHPADVVAGGFFFSAPGVPGPRAPLPSLPPPPRPPPPRR